MANLGRQRENYQQKLSRGAWYRKEREGKASGQTDAVSVVINRTLTLITLVRRMEFNKKLE